MYLDARRPANCITLIQTEIAGYIKLIILLSVTVYVAKT